MVSFIAHPVERRPHSMAGRVLGGIVAVCGAVPYALVALLLRFVMARVFFLSGQAKIAGPSIPLHIEDFTFTVTLPTQLREDALHAFELQFADAPVWPTLLAYVFVYAEFILPICLLIGFGTRIVALLLLLMTIALQVYVHPDALWTTHAYWAAILLVLMACGPGALSLDRLIWYLYKK
jgi:putative oxidoreductase